MAEVSPLRRRMIEDMTISNLSPATQQSYIYAVAKFSRHCGRSPDRLELEDVRTYQQPCQSTCDSCNNRPHFPGSGCRRSPFLIGSACGCSLLIPPFRASLIQGVRRGPSCSDWRPTEKKVYQEASTDEQAVGALVGVDLHHHCPDRARFQPRALVSR
jgi:hypothetical protein